MSAAIFVIDISPFRGNGAGEAAAAAAIAEACGRWGFFRAVGDGIPAGLVERVWRQAGRFFALPQEEKLAISHTKENPHGYYDWELTKNSRDLKEVFDYGSVPYLELPADHPKNRLAVDGYNQWPAALPEFQSTMIEHYRACEALAFALMEAFCLGLGVPRDRLDRHFEGGHASFARLNYYPLDDPLETEQAAGAAPFPLARGRGFGLFIQGQDQGRIYGRHHRQVGKAAPARPPGRRQAPRRGPAQEGQADGQGAYRALTRPRLV